MRAVLRTDPLDLCTLCLLPGVPFQDLLSQNSPQDSDREEDPCLASERMGELWRSGAHGFADSVAVAAMKLNLAIVNENN
mgnify:CR=1 FL=1